MPDKTAQVIVLRTFGIVLFLLALAMVGARVFGGLDLSMVIPISLMTIGISNLVIAQAVGKGQDQPD